MQASSGDPDETPHSVASDLGLHCLPISNKKEARLKWVKSVFLQLPFTVILYECMPHFCSH